MEWYIPITILPGIGLLILSTSNILISLNDEIKELNKEKNKFKIIIQKKINQLKKLNYALIGQYLASFTLVIGGVVGEVSKNDKLTIYLVLISVILLSVSIGLLIYFSLISLKIRKEHLKI